ncbi:zinc ABC transporter solute-binding protein [Heliobacterium gestii]|uniref:Zinc ABC transporter solute-binding protein n=1 Tax=Heliomicrobium gestii TaxID=2699 RepID=A0A845LD62_HELGE|nr:metal ABC transporter substrate-binding protein [Heliomicrobium gestii]MBM7866345.1 zinc transport system substrate-binding protein [Heliomicrobium gestii]MZP42870.1 zinc ABC transporter solute-binding protein [Heliomicrobium gestii]
MRKALHMVGTGLLTLALLAGCAAKGPATSPNEAAGSKKLNVVASFYPMYEFTRQVGGDKVDVLNLVPPGSEPHDWEPTPKDMETMAKANLLVVNGGMEGWLDKVIGGGSLKNVTVIEAGKGVERLPAGEEEEASPGAGGRPDGGEPGDHHHEFDPHFWVSPKQAKVEVENIKKGLVAADPANSEYYENNAKAYLAKLDTLDQEFRDGLSNTKRKEIIVTHRAFGYLARDYGLTQLGIMGVNPETEPTPKTMAEITTFAKEHHVKYIFFEALISPKLAEAIAKEAGAQTLVLNPLDGITAEDLKAGKDYIAVQRENLTNIKKALSGE